MFSVIRRSRSITYRSHCVRDWRKLTLEPLEDRQLLATCHVTRLSDTGVGKGFRGDLRYCITRANTDAGEDLIIFSATAHGTINLTGALPDISDDLIIAGPGPDTVTVRRDSGGDYRIFTIYSGKNVQIYSITISNGYAVALTSDEECWGGGIFNDGTLTVGSVVITGNRTGGIECHGGGIFNDGTLLVVNSTISANDVNAAFNGYGGGIDNHGNATIVNSTISGNQAEDVGGGIISMNGTLYLRHSTITDNRYVKSDASFYGGGGIYGADVDARNTIIAGNQAHNGAPSDLKAVEFKSSGHNLIGNSTGGTGYAPTDILDVDPMLGPLADNGGPTLTHALLPGSPAIDAGDNADAPEWDQRGPGFPRIVKGTIDIGAFEVQATPIPPAPWAFLITANLADVD